MGNAIWLHKYCQECAVAGPSCDFCRLKLPGREALCFAEVCTQRLKVNSDAYHAVVCIATWRESLRCLCLEDVSVSYRW
jgi:hypothetical protein